MSVFFIGSINLASAIPGFGQAIGGIQGAVGGLNAMKLDKRSLLDAAVNDLAPLAGAITAASNAIAAGENLLHQAEDVLGQASGIANDLLSTLGGAGVYMFRYEGGASNFGIEMAQAIQNESLSTGTIEGVVILAADGAAISALGKIFRLA